MVSVVSLSAARDASLHLQFLQCLVECEDRMGWRRIAELAVFFEAAELPEQIEAQAAGPTLGGQQLGAAGDHKGKARNTFDAFVGGGNEVINLSIGEIDWDRGEAAHGIDK